MSKSGERWAEMMEDLQPTEQDYEEMYEAKLIADCVEYAKHDATFIARLEKELSNVRY